MIYEIAIPQTIKVLKNLNDILGKAATYAESKKFDATVLLNSRLAPDQFNFTRQIQIACDTAKLGASRLSGKDAPVHDDKEMTIPELNKRVQDTIAYLSSFSAQDFNGAEERQITHARWEGKHLLGIEFALQHMIPNLYFHVTTAYAILRHNGVDLGKKDYLGEMPYKK